MKKIICLAALFCCFFIGSAQAAVSPEVSPELTAVTDSLSDFIANRQENGEDWAACFINLDTLESCCPKQEDMPAASLIKLFIMGTVYESYDSLCDSYGTEEIETLLYHMITVSDNDSANTLTRYLGNLEDAAGRQAVNDYCLRNGYEDTFMGRMLLAPSDNGDNVTSANDCSQFLLKIYQKELPHADEMLSLLKQQQRTHKIPRGIPEGVPSANKTGELSDVENDAAIIFAEHPYILTVMSRDLTDTGRAQDDIAFLSGTVYSITNP